jgi:glycosyltransferase involved in cell wall biosynthesis
MDSTSPIALTPERTVPQQWVGVYQAEWPVNKHTLYLLNALAQLGYGVDLFCYQSHFPDNPEEYCTHRHIHIHDLSPPDVHQRVRPLSVKAKRGVEKATSYIKEKYLLLKRNYEDFIPDRVSNKVFEISKGKHYICFLGVEKFGLVWAAQVARKLNIPYLYYSLELYTRHGRFCTLNDRRRRLKVAESTACQHSAAIIVQDEQRAGILFEDNDLAESHPAIYCPISQSGACYNKQTSYLRERFNIPEDKILILQFGQIKRYGRELIQLAQTFPDNYLLVLHDGLIRNFLDDQPLVSELKAIDSRNKVIFSLDDLGSGLLQAMTASADVGLALYPNRDDNNRLTIFSSEKIALYLQCGLPVIGFNYPGYELLENTGSGVLIQELKEIPAAADKILSEHKRYRNKGQKLFLEKYQFERNFKNISRFIDQLNLSKNNA